MLMQFFSQSQEFVSFQIFILTMEFNRSWGNVIRCRGPVAAAFAVV